MTAGRNVILAVAVVGLAPLDVSLDSHARYLPGLPLATGLAFWTTMKPPEPRAELYLAVTLGGLARRAKRTQPFVPR